MLTEGPSATRDETQAALRRDIRELGVLLGRTHRAPGGARDARARRARAPARAHRPRRRRRRPRGGRPAHGDPPRPRLLDLLPPGQRGRAGPPRPRRCRPRASSAGSWLAQAVERITSAAVAPGELSADIAPPRGAPGLHRPPHRGGAAHRPHQAAPGRRACSTSASAPWARPRSAASSAAWRSSSTCCGRATSCASPSPTSSTRRATPSTTSTSCTATRCPTRSRRWSTSSARLGVDLPGRGAPAALRQLDRRRPRRQPQRPADDDARRPRAPARARAARRAGGDRRAARRPLLLGADHRRHARSSRPRWPPTSSACPSSTSATGA